jgi:hypothetical protein
VLHFIRMARGMRHLQPLARLVLLHEHCPQCCPAGGGSEAGIHLDGGSGSPVEIQISQCWAFYVNKAVYITVRLCAWCCAALIASSFLP